MRGTSLRLRRPVPARRARGIAAAAVFAPLAALLAVAPPTMHGAGGAGTRSPARWTAVFFDGFSGAAGSRVDSRWAYDIGTRYLGAGCTANWGTGEVESDTSSTAAVSLDGHGHLRVTPVKSGGAWRSGRIETVAENFAAPAGGELKVTAAIRQPNPARGLGYWPAFWMLGAAFRSHGAGTSGTMNCSKWPSVGEIDILESANARPQHSGTLHCGTDPGGPCSEPAGLGSGLRSCPGCRTGYNTYSVIINRTHSGKESITWYLNGNAYLTVTEAQAGVAAWQKAVDHGFFLILDVAMGGGFPDAVCGCTTPSALTTPGAAMSVDYVAVYRTGGTGSSAAAHGTRSGDRCARNNPSYKAR